MITKIPVSQLTIGMYLHKIPCSWADHPFLKNAFTIKSQKQIDAIKSNGIQEVFIDTGKGLSVKTEKKKVECKEEAGNRSDGTPKKSPPKKPSREASINNAKKVCSEAKEVVKSMFSDIRMGKALETRAINPVVKSIVSSVGDNNDALLNVARLKTQSDYTYMHSVAVCGLMVALAKKMGLGAKQVEHAGLAGLLHDIGKIAIQDEILNKPGKLSDKEFLLIKTHTIEGHKILAKANIDEPVMDVCLHHHEKIDGTGYPHGLKGDEISLLAKMGAVCDVYDAVTSNRPYNDGWDPGLTLKRMASWEGHFDKDIFSKFVQCLGIYPVGTLVKVSTGHLAVIVEQGSNDFLRPVVKIFYSTKSRMMCPVKIVDLAKSKNEITIESIEKASVWNIEVADDFWM